MFLSAKDFLFLIEIERKRKIIFNNFLDYKNKVENSNLKIKTHLKNCYESSLVKGFSIPIFTLNSMYEGQVTNGLFNPTYIMPEDNFLKNKKTLNELYDIYYKEDNKNFSEILDPTLRLIKKIPNLLQSMLVVLKDGCIFSPHVHDEALIYWYKLDDNKGDLFVTVNNIEKAFNNINRSLLFNGNSLHSGTTKMHTPSVYLVAAFN